MKQKFILAVLLFVAFLSSFTACGEEDDGQVPDEKTPINDQEPYPSPVKMDVVQVTLAQLPEYLKNVEEKNVSICISDATGDNSYNNSKPLRDFSEDESHKISLVLMSNDNLDRIGGGAFQDVTALESIVIPLGVKTIAKQSFARCTSLKSVYLYDMVAIQDDSFEGCSEDLTIYVPDNLIKDYRATYPKLNFRLFPEFNISYNPYSNLVKITIFKDFMCEDIYKVIEVDNGSDFVLPSEEGFNVQYASAVNFDLLYKPGNIFLNVSEPLYFVIVKSEIPVAQKVKITFYKDMYATEIDHEIEVDKGSEYELPSEFGYTIQYQSARQFDLMYNPGDVIKVTENLGFVVYKTMQDVIDLNVSNLSHVISKAQSEMEKELYLNLEGTGDDSNNKFAKVIQSAPEINFYINLKMTVAETGGVKIGGWQFRDCPNLKEVILNEGLENIGGYGFAGCTGLKSIKLPSTIVAVDKTAFDGNSEDFVIYVPQGRKAEFQAINSKWKIEEY